MYSQLLHKFKCFQLPSVFSKYAAVESCIFIVTLVFSI